MIYLDSSILVSAIVRSQPFHSECLSILNDGQELVCLSHTLSETFSTLTGGRIGMRVPTNIVNQTVIPFVLERLRVEELNIDARLDAYRDAESRGVRGGAIHDYLHLVCARETGAEKLATLNIRHFVAFHRDGDPEIVHPVQIIT